MEAQAYHLCPNMTVDQVYDSMQPVGDVPIYASQLQIWLASKGLKNDWKSLTLLDLFTNLVQKKPMIALIHYAALVDAGFTQKKDFRGSHFVVVTGVDIESVAIHDPYRDDGSGVNQPIPINTFMQAWSEATLDNNLPFCALVPQVAICDLSIPPAAWIDYNIVPNGIYVHSGPAENTPILRIAWKGEILRIVKVVGQYAQMTDGNYVWFAYLKKI
jgi:hypothetical protein